MEEHLIQGLSAESPPPEYGLDVARARSLAGTYRQLTWRFPGRQSREALRIVHRAGGLYTVFGEGRERRLIPVSAEFYRRESENRATRFLGVGADGNTYFQGDEGNYLRVGD